jgi:CRP/FNR family transcriptional regulator
MEFLNNIIEFKFLKQDRKEEFLLYGNFKTYKAGDVILNENAYIKSIPIVVSGNIKVTKTDDDGKEMLLYYIKQGESCVMSFLGAVYHDTAKLKVLAEEDSEVFFISAEKLPDFIKKYPEWLDYTFRLYHMRFEELLSVINAIAFKKMDVRLLDFIKKKSELNQTKTLHITHEQIANELGTARVVISRLLKQLEQEGLVKLGRNKIIVV